MSLTFRAAARLKSLLMTLSSDRTTARRIPRTRPVSTPVPNGCAVYQRLWHPLPRRLGRSVLPALSWSWDLRRPSISLLWRSGQEKDVAPAPAPLPWRLRGMLLRAPLCRVLPWLLLHFRLWMFRQARKRRTPCHLYGPAADLCAVLDTGSDGEMAQASSPPSGPGSPVLQRPRRRSIWHEIDRPCL